MRTSVMGGYAAHVSTAQRPHALNDLSIALLRAFLVFGYPSRCGAEGSFDRGVPARRRPGDPMRERSDELAERRRRKSSTSSGPRRLIGGAAISANRTAPSSPIFSVST